MLPEPTCHPGTDKIYNMVSQQVSLRLGEWLGRPVPPGHGLAARGPKGSVGISADLLSYLHFSRGAML